MASLLLATPVHVHTLYGGTIKVIKVAPDVQHCHSNGASLSRHRSQIQSRYRIIDRILQNPKADIKNVLNFKIFATSRSSNNQVPQSLTDKSDVPQKEHSYLFRTKSGGLVKVVVGDRTSTYSVDIEVSFLPRSSCENDLLLDCGMFRSDASNLYVSESLSSSSGISRATSEVGLSSIKMPFIQDSLGRHILKLIFDSSQVPFYLSFLLHSLSDSSASESEIKSHRNTRFCVPVGIGRGSPMPLGMSVSCDGFVNFALFSRNAESVILCLYEEQASQPSLEIELDPYVNRTGDIWHISMASVGQFVSYGYRCKGTPLWDNGSGFHMHHVLLDPYAKRLVKFSPDQHEANCLGCLKQGPIFDWSTDAHPHLPMEKLVVYRLNVGQFTQDRSSGLPEDVAGTFIGVAEKLQHFRNLGINTILLEPIFPFDEQTSPYLPYHFFTPMNLCGHDCDGISAITSMKMMVKTLHEHGIEVLLEVVFTHTAEGGDAASQVISFRGIDNSSYYFVDGDMMSGANNTLKCDNPVVQQMILDSLRYWVTDFHIDGFCFIDASSLVRGSNHDYLPRPPLIEAIAFDPILSKTKIIADCWSPLEMSYKNINFPHWKRWAEINSKFCVDVRNFLRGKGLISDLATRLCGSGDIFSAARGPAFSFNFIAKNFGLSLVDLVSFSSAELASELSWNSGEEGPTNNKRVLETRLKQIRNFLFVLFVSLGVPVLNMGDELGHTTGGSSLYADRLPINWNNLKTGFSTQITQFIAFLSKFRVRRSDLFQRRDYLKVENIQWQGSGQSLPKWEDPTCKFISMTLKAEDDKVPSSNSMTLKAEDDKVPSSNEEDVLIAFNAGDLSESLVLPELPEGATWLRLVDTAKPFPGFFSNDSDLNVHQAEGLSTYELKAHSCALFEAKNIC